MVSLVSPGLSTVAGQLTGELPALPPPAPLPPGELPPLALPPLPLPALLPPVPAVGDEPPALPPAPEPAVAGVPPFDEVPAVDGAVPAVVGAVPPLGVPAEVPPVAGGLPAVLLGELGSSVPHALSAAASDKTEATQTGPRKRASCCAAERSMLAP